MKRQAQPIKRKKPIKRTGIKRTPLKSAQNKKADAVLWKWFSIFIRLRDAQPENGVANCFTCGRPKHWREGDCGHGIPRQHKATKYHEQNNHFQCKRCNGFEEGKKDVYAIEVDKRYGAGTWNKLEVMARQICKRGQFEIEMMTEHYKREAQKLSKQKNLPIQ
jgi:hypothetical protein